jgi:hypothetical protein
MSDNYMYDDVPDDATLHPAGPGVGPLTQDGGTLSHDEPGDLYGNLAEGDAALRPEPFISDAGVYVPLPESTALDADQDASGSWVELPGGVEDVPTLANLKRRS